MPLVHHKILNVDEHAIDIHQHVNNQEYLRWMQELAIEHSTLQGWPMARYLAAGCSWYVKTHFIEYLRPSVLGDTILAATWVGKMRRRSSVRHTIFRREADQQLIARAETNWIFVSLHNARPLPIPPEVSEVFHIVDSQTDALRYLKFN